MARQSKCGKCGAELAFFPEGNSLRCKSCGSEVTINVSDKYPRHEFDIKVMSRLEPSKLNRSVLSKCPNCGGAYTSNILTLSSKCDYCGTNMVTDDKASHPDGCLPFSYGKASALKMFEDYVKTKKYVPDEFMKKPKLDSIDSLYLPVYTFNAELSSGYDGELSETHTDSDGDSHTSYFKISGTEMSKVNNLIVECSEHINQYQLGKIEPFDMSALKKFSPAFVYGYSVEYYNKSIEEASSMAKHLIEDRVRKQILSRYNYDDVEHLNIDYKYITADYSYILVPTYRIRYKYKEKEYSSLMNGQTGKIYGNFPTSAWKVFRTVLITLGTILGIGAIIFILVALISL